MNLTEEEQEQAATLLNSLPSKEVNRAALDRKYDEEWYEEKLHAARGLDEYFSDVKKVASMHSRADIVEGAEQHQRQMSALIETLENVLDDLDESSRPAKPRTT